MGWQLRGGHIVTDEEATAADLFIYRVIAFLLTTLSLGTLGYFLGGKWLMVALGIIGATLGIVFSKFMVALTLVALLVAMVGGVAWLAIKLVS